MGNSGGTLLGVEMAGASVVRRARRAVSLATSMARPLPGFLIIGGIRCGTTSLIHYLDDHPSLGMSAIDEVHYFDWHYEEGEAWYRSWFPITIGDGPDMVGESSPSYLMNPLVPERVAALLPDVKLIVLLRNPVDRAVSHYNLRRSGGRESQSTFEAALEQEAARVGPTNHRRPEIGGRIDCYFEQGTYVTGLRRWLGYVDRSQMHIIDSGELFASPATTYRGVQDFLGVPPHGLEEYERLNAATYRAVDLATRSSLQARYEPYNQELYELVGRDFGW